MGIPCEPLIKIESQIANILRRRNRRGGLVTECVGDVGGLGTVHHNTPSPTLGLYITRVFLEVMGGCDRIIMRGKDTRMVSECSQEGHRLGSWQ